MLAEIHIRNFALIDRLSVQFGPGLNVLTGETGAGKSIIIDAIAAILGERADTTQVRTGTDRALIDACFRLDQGGLPEGADAALAEDGALVISREISVSGRSQARVNGRPATLGMIREVARGLVDLHGQHEHQSLLQVDRHMRVLDHWIGSEAVALLQRIREKHSQWTELRCERERLLTDERVRARQIDLLRFQVDEISAAKLVPGEEEQLQADRLRLASAEKLAEAAAEAMALISEDDRSAIECLSKAVVRLRDAARLDPSLAGLADAVENAFYLLEDSARELRSYAESIEFNPSRLNLIEERLDLIRGLKRKYGDSIEQILEYAETAARELEQLEQYEARSQELDAEISQAERELAALCEQMSELRHAAAVPLAQAVMRELSDLGMEKARFAVQIDHAPMGPDGADAVEFMLSANPGEPLKPLARVASGGELSRVMLALKTVMSRTDRVPVMIFDEIDVGIGGSTGNVLARKLRSLAETNQVLCVTHLPQIAAAAHNHYCVRKVEAGGRTQVEVKQLYGDERLRELARMLGDPESESALRHARSMLSAFQCHSESDTSFSPGVGIGAGL
ncbi:MAG: DNA repair protein RecN [Armatimonadota bacterium]